MAAAQRTLHAQVVPPCTGVARGLGRFVTGRNTPGRERAGQRTDAARDPGVALLERARALLERIANRARLNRLGVEISQDDHVASRAPESLDHVLLLP